MLTETEKAEHKKDLLYLLTVATQDLDENPKMKEMCFLAASVMESIVMMGKPGDAMYLERLLGLAVALGYRLGWEKCSRVGQKEEVSNVH